ncbi:MAG: hypothetical protein WA210_00520 [Burkholderiaceae bacterium]
MPGREDTRAAQAERVADHLERHPEGLTLVELNAACDLGCATKVVSAMALELGYGIGHGPRRRVECVNGTKWRSVRTYTLLHRPANGVQLSLVLE